MNTMSQSEILYSARTWQRMEIIKEELEQHYANIKKLRDFNQGKETLKGKGYTWKAACSSRTRDDRARTYRTLQHLRVQIALLEREYFTLQNYGM